MQAMKYRISLYHFLPGIAWFFIVLFLIGMPGRDIPGNSFLESINFDKMVHALIFGLMVILFVRPLAASAMPVAHKKNYFILITICCILWGLATEYIQKYFVQGRDFDLWDFAADALGAGIAFLFSIKYLLHYFTKK